MKKALITLEYDSTSQIVAEKSYEFTKEMQAEIILLHIISNLEAYYTSYLGSIAGMIPPK